MYTRVDKELVCETSRGFRSWNKNQSARRETFNPGRDDGWSVNRIGEQQGVYGSVLLISMGG